MKVWGLVGSGLGFELETSRAEIQQEAMFNFGGSKIIDQLSRVGSVQSVHRLQFNNELSSDNQVGLKDSNLDAFVHYRQWYMTQVWNFRVTKLDDEGVSVNGFQKTTTKGTVNLHRQANDLLGENILGLHLKNPILHSVNLVNLVIP